ncbi:hypothetical protein GCM10009119_38780 [Algoriphagus jejuensis]|uniref:Uncharacterized protein n=1 Tax=Algoriphagus jejuensis TaxID=419934 RepID=A0ABN1N5H8_9BACT
MIDLIECSPELLNTSKAFLMYTSLPLARKEANEELALYLKTITSNKTLNTETS